MLEKRPGMTVRIHQQGIIVKGEIPHPEAGVPVFDFGQDPRHGLPPVHRGQPRRGAVGAAIRAPAHGEQGRERNPALQVEGRKGMGVQVVRVKTQIRPAASNLGRQVDHGLFPGTGHNPVSAGILPGMIRA